MDMEAFAPFEGIVMFTEIPGVFCRPVMLKRVMRAMAGGTGTGTGV
jgi:hypothetical protein